MTRLAVLYKYLIGNYCSSSLCNVTHLTRNYTKIFVVLIIQNLADLFEDILLLFFHRIVLLNIRSCFS